MWDSGSFSKLTEQDDITEAEQKKIIQAIESVVCACEICDCEIGGWGGRCLGIADCRAWLSIDIPEMLCQLSVLKEMQGLHTYSE